MDRRSSLLHHLEKGHGLNRPDAMLEAEPSFLKAHRKLGALGSSTVAAFFTPRWVARHVLSTVAAQWSGWAPAGCTCALKPAEVPPLPPGTAHLAARASEPICVPLCCWDDPGG